MSRTILVTGGAGFLGSHLCDRLIAAGDRVICMDNLFTGVMLNIQHLIGNPNFEFIRHDVTESFKFESIDQIYNLSCPAAPGHYQFNPVKTMKTSVLGTMHALGLARKTKATILQASTSEVYGDPQVHPQPESYRGSVNPIGPRACYDEGKRAAESLMFDYHRQYRTPIKVVRIFNTYGPRMHPFDGRVVSNFIRQAIAGQELTIYGDGSQSRSFCYVDDLVEGLVRAMNTSSDFTGPVNLGNPHEFTIAQLAQSVVRLVGGNTTIASARPLPQDDPMQRCPDISLARKVLNWESTVQLDEGLRRTIEWFRSIDMSQFRAPTPNY